MVKRRSERLLKENARIHRNTMEFIKNTKGKKQEEVLI